METTARKPTFSDLINSNKPVLVDFSAEWCGPCKLMKPILEELRQKLGNKATVIEVDTDKNPILASAYNIRGVPTLILFKQREIKWRQSGVVPANYLEHIVLQYAS